jgi:hypothetical protein
MLGQNHATSTDRIIANSTLYRKYMKYSRVCFPFYGTYHKTRLQYIIKGTWQREAVSQSFLRYQLLIGLSLEICYEFGLTFPRYSNKKKDAKNTQPPPSTSYYQAATLIQKSHQTVTLPTLNDAGNYQIPAGIFR